MHLNIQWNFQISISVPLIQMLENGSSIQNKWTVWYLFQLVGMNFLNVAHVQLSSNVFILCLLRAILSNWRQWSMFSFPSIFYIYFIIGFGWRFCEFVEKRTMFMVYVTSGDTGARMKSFKRLCSSFFTDRQERHCFYILCYIHLFT